MDPKKTHTLSSPPQHSPWALAEVVCRVGGRLQWEGLADRDLVLHHMYVRLSTRVCRV